MQKIVITFEILDDAIPVQAQLDYKDPEQGWMVIEQFGLCYKENLDNVRFE